MTIFVLVGAVLVIIWEMFHEKISLNSVLLLLLGNFVSGCMLELMYISLIRLSLDHHFCICTDKTNLLNIKRRQAGNPCKRVPDVPKLAYANETKESITSQKLDSWEFWQIANSVLNKGKNLGYFLYSMAQRCLPSASDKAKLFAENSNFHDSDISLPPFPFRTNLKLHTQDGYKNHNEPWFVKGIWSWLYSSGSSKELQAWAFLHTSWTLQYVSERVLFSRLLEGCICGPCI